MIKDLPDRAQMIVVLAAVFHTARLLRGEYDSAPGVDPTFFDGKPGCIHCGREVNSVVYDLDRATAFVTEVERRFPDKPAKPPKGK